MQHQLCNCKGTDSEETIIKATVRYRSNNQSSKRGDNQQSERDKGSIRKKTNHIGTYKKGINAVRHGYCPTIDYPHDCRGREEMANISCLY